MHTKHSHLLHIRKAAAMLCAALFLCACNYERIPDDSGEEQDGEFITVTLSVGTATGQQSLTTKGADGQNSINDIYILAFQAEDLQLNDFRLKYYATGRQPESSGQGGSKKFTFTLRRSFKADTKLLLVANQNPYSKVEIGMTLDDVQKKLLSDVLTGAPRFTDTGMPMIGFAENTKDALLISNEIKNLSANLLRPVARVDVGVGKYENGGWNNNGGVAFQLKEVHVFKPQNKYSLLPLMDNLEYTNGQDTPSRTPFVNKPSQLKDAQDPSDDTALFVYKGDENISTNTSGATYCEAKIFLPEVEFEGTVLDGNYDQRMALVIGGEYKGTGMNYYRIDFTTEPTNVAGTTLQDVLRNRIYRYTISSVNQPGYTTAAAAYKGKPIPLGFSASIVKWETGTIDPSPAPDLFVRMNFEGINGTIVTGEMIEGEGNKPIKFTIQKKKETFVTDNGSTRYSPLPYNELRGEVKDNTFNGYGNGGMYKSVQDALNREGPFGTLIIAPDNATDETGVAWRSKGESKKDRLLDAKKACWDYRGQGQSDWRLPRLSELMLLWMNKETINSTKGFTSLGEGEVTYWTGTEGDPGGNKDANTAYTVSKSGVIKLEEKTVPHLVRCVREVRNQSK
ncbi:DUF1566 domain-containing protein [Parabacteroides gordonii]|uniref:Lcl domain-containing protein n=1 Tax=Parabacteroides gordonii TaxID=574930 RepID=UPI0026F14FCB|nr:DUF1566 domain-containing protein [Parabacteroides gordonii]